MTALEAAILSEESQPAVAERYRIAKEAAQKAAEEEAARKQAEEDALIEKRYSYLQREIERAAREAERQLIIDTKLGDPIPQIIARLQRDGFVATHHEAVHSAFQRSEFVSKYIIKW
jgi:ribulose 1,5-bisphosphate carboxylase large subunit-like protein